VAKSNSGLSYGASLEYFNAGANSQVNCGGCLNQPSLSQRFNQFGLNIFIGKGDFTFQASHRGGSGSQSQGSDGLTFQNNNIKASDNEISVRWIARPLSIGQHFFPYISAGYKWGDFDMPATGTTYNNISLSTTTSYTAPTLALGAILPINNTYGFRVEARQNFYITQLSYHFYSFDSSNDKIGRSGQTYTGTFYYNLTDNVNVQVGTRYNVLPANSGFTFGNTPANDLGYFLMLGYSYK
jgi:hypothetical protein